MPFPILAAAGLASGLVSGLFGASQRKQGKRLLANNPRPTYDIPQEQFENKALASQMAASGMGASQYGQASQNIQRNQTASINAAQNRRGGIGAISGIQQRTNDAQLGLDAQNAQMRRQNQQLLIGANNTLSGYRDKAFQYNKLQPYQENRAYGMSLLSAGNQNIMGGIDKAFGGAVSQWGGNMFSGGGLFGGSGRRMKGGATGDPTYYGGYNANSDYGTFENGY